MSKISINIGSAPNDGTGDPLRTAMDSINQNFTELYTTNVASGTLVQNTYITVGNSTGNVVVNPSSVNVNGSVTVNTSGIYTPIINATSVTLGSNLVLNTSAVFIGNTTANLIQNSTIVSISNSSGIANLQPTQLKVGASIVNSAGFYVGSSLSVNASGIGLGSNLSILPSTINIANATSNVALNYGQIFVGNTINNTVITSTNVTTNTVTTNGLNLGVKSTTTNGYSSLANGLKINWGILTVNTTSSITYSSAFSTNTLSITVTPMTTDYVGANTIIVYSTNATSANVQSASTTTTGTAYFLAIGY